MSIYLVHIDRGFLLSTGITLYAIQGLQRKQTVSSEKIETVGGGFMRFWVRLSIDGESEGLLVVFD